MKEYSKELIRNLGLPFFATITVMGGYFMLKAFDPKYQSSPHQETDMKDNSGLEEKIHNLENNSSDKSFQTLEIPPKEHQLKTECDDR